MGKINGAVSESLQALIYLEFFANGKFESLVMFHNLCSEISAALCDFFVFSVVSFSQAKFHHREHGEVTES
ncbi:MAG TPA: hypothetical protein VGB02_03980 [Pyrinomonadaceae bacterium]|jgi:hypothetical protein